MIQTNFKRFQIIFSQISDSQIILKSSNNIDSTYNSVNGEMIIIGKTKDNEESANYIIESEISDKDVIKFRIF